MTLRTRSRVLLPLLALVVGGCAAEWSDAQPVRDGLRSGSLTFELLDRNEQDEHVRVDAPLLTVGDALAWCDHARVRDGRDARVAGEYVLVDGGVEVRGCGSPLAAEPQPLPWQSAGAVSPDVLPRLDAALPRLLGWVAGCATPPAGDAPVRVAVVDGAPLGLAWLPVEGVLLVNPAVLAPLAEAGRSADPTRTLGTALIGANGYEACLEELGAECETCLASGGTECEPLFVSGETCVELSVPTAGVERYCLWRTYETERSRLLCLSQALEPNPLDRCLVPGVVVVSVATLWQAILNHGPGQVCTESLEACASGEIPPPSAFQPNWAARSDQIIFDVQECADRLSLYCAACIDPAGPGCPALFPGSVGPGDCFDLNRPENADRGEWLYCASMAVTQGNIACLNAAGACVERFYWEGGITGYNEMLLAMASSLVHPTECEARFALCSDGGGAPFPDYNDNGDAPPTFDPFASSGGNGGGGSGKCGG